MARDFFFTPACVCVYVLHTCRCSRSSCLFCLRSALGVHLSIRFPRYWRGNKPSGRFVHLNVSHDVVRSPRSVQLFGYLRSLVCFWTIVGSRGVFFGFRLGGAICFRDCISWSNMLFAVVTEQLTACVWKIPQVLSDGRFIANVHVGQGQFIWEARHAMTQKRERQRWFSKLRLTFPLSSPRREGMIANAVRFSRCVSDILLSSVYVATQTVHSCASGAVKPSVFVMPRSRVLTVARKRFRPQCIRGFAKRRERLSCSVFIDWIFSKAGSGIAFAFSGAHAGHLGFGFDSREFCLTVFVPCVTRRISRSTETQWDAISKSNASPASLFVLAEGASWRAVYGPELRRLPRPPEE